MLPAIARISSFEKLDKQQLMEITSLSRKLIDFAHSKNTSEFQWAMDFIHQTCSNGLICLFKPFIVKLLQAFSTPQAVAAKVSILIASKDLGGFEDLKIITSLWVPKTLVFLQKRLEEHPCVLAPNLEDLPTSH